MIIERAMTPDWLSNTYLVAAGPGGDALLVDAGGPADELFAKADEHDLAVTHVLLTHHHGDHVAALGTVMRADTVRDMAAAAGYAQTQILPIENDLFRFYRLRT